MNLRQTSHARKAKEISMTFAEGRLEFLTKRRLTVATCGGVD